MAATQDAFKRAQTQVPVTPERGRSRSRYPSHLSRELDAQGNPRPLLHRRGTSRTYETLEELLTEAGYKETRIFTPEIEPRDAARDEHKENVAKEQGEIRGVGGAVVKLLTTWMSTASRRAGVRRTFTDDDDNDDDNDRVKVPSSSPLAHRSAAAATRHMQSPPSPSKASRKVVRPLSSSSFLQQQHSLTRPSLTASSTSTLHQPSRARTALRHAVSTSQIDKRRHAGRTQPPRTSRPHKATPPPLPPTWFESISAALLSPRLHTHTHASPSPPAPRPPVVARKPSSYILTQRAHVSPGAVTITHVVCRSAPSSRSSSAVRPARAKAAAAAAARVPTLAQTSVCAETAAWPAHSPHALPAAPPPPLPPLPALPVLLHPDDDEDDELNLATMLIPAKRQHSIRSLRSVLLQTQQQHNSLSREYARLMRRRIQENEPGAGAGDDDGGHWDSGEFLTARIKRKRSRIPQNWGWAS